MNKTTTISKLATLALTILFATNLCGMGKKARNQNGVHTKNGQRNRKKRGRPNNAALKALIMAAEESTDSNTQDAIEAEVTTLLSSPPNDGARSTIETQYPSVIGRQNEQLLLKARMIGQTTEAPFIHSEPTTNITRSVDVGTQTYEPPKQQETRHLYHNALFGAALNGDDTTIIFLLDRGACINAQNEDGATPLHLAITCGRTNTAALLLDRGADPNAQTKNGKTPLYFALPKRDPQLIELLRSRNAHT